METNEQNKSLLLFETFINSIQVNKWIYFDDMQNDIMNLIREYKNEKGLVNAEDIKTEIEDYFNNLKY